jgi:hypothetical protein
VRTFNRGAGSGSVETLTLGVTSSSGWKQWSATGSVRGHLVRRPDGTRHPLTTVVTYEGQSYLFQQSGTTAPNSLRYSAFG